MKDDDISENLLPSRGILVYNYVKDFSFKVLNFQETDINDPTKANFKYQTFRIINSTTFGDLLKSCFSLWDIKEFQSLYCIKFIDESDIVIPAPVNGMILDFLKVKTNINIGRFIFLKNSKLII